MNQGTRMAEKPCAICKKNTTLVCQWYNTHISDWEDRRDQIPICIKCDEKVRKSMGKI